MYGKDMIGVLDFAIISLVFVVKEDLHSLTNNIVIHHLNHLNARTS